MAGSLNQVELIGHLGGDPESRSFPNGGKVVNFSLATGETWKDRSTGEKKERTEWHRIAIFVGDDGRGPGDFVERYLKKGSYVYIRGQLETRKWQDQQGQDRYSTEVVLRGFNGQVVSLDKVQQDAGSRGYDNRGYGGRDSGSSGGGSRGGSSGGSGSRGGGSGGGQGGFGGSGFTDELDDDVPF